MLIKEFINTQLPLLNGKHNVKKALKVMKEFHIGYLSVYINGNYGYLSYTALKEIAKDTLLSETEHLMVKISLLISSHIWESARLFSQYETEVFPVVNENNIFCGSLQQKDIFAHIPNIFPIENGGAILELEMSYQDYSLSEISNIVEGNNAKIILLSVLPIKGTSKVNITFTIDKIDATEVIQSLERHNYQVKAWFMNNGKIDNILEERYDAFMKYINV